MLCTAILLVACGKKQKPQMPVVVSATEVQQRDVTVHHSWVGLLSGYQNSQIRAQVTGYLISQNYHEGSFVKKGSTLFMIDSRPFEADLAQAQADYAQKVAQAQLAQITLDRQTELYKTKVISQQEFDTAAQNARASAAAAAAAQASVQAAQVNLNYTTIIAPFDGIAGRAVAQIGDLVGPGGSETVLTELSQLDPIKAVFSITEDQYLSAAALLQRLTETETVKNPAKLTMQLANGEDFSHKGRFDFVNRQVDISTGTIEIDGLFPNPGNVLRPGLFVKVTAPVEELDNALVVPQLAVMELQGIRHVAILNEDDTATIQPVEVGPTDGQDWVITSGVKLGQKVVVGGIEKVRPGVKLKVEPYKPDPSLGKGDSNSKDPTPSPTPSPSPSTPSSSSQGTEATATPPTPAAQKSTPAASPSPAR